MTDHEGKQVTGLVQYSAINKSHCEKASMTGNEGKQVTGLVQCYGVERFHEGKPSVTVQRQTSSERYVCLSQGQAKRRPSLWQCIGNTWWKWTIRWPSQGQAIRPARHMALHCEQTTYKQTVQAPRPRPGYSPGPA